MARITFYGAARTVTGSKFLLEAGPAKVLVDCGLFQGLKQLRLKNWEPTPFDLKSLDAVVLTHAHLDHTGYLPRIVREGYVGPIYGTDATNELAELIMLDSAKCQEQEADYANRKGYSKHKPALPLYVAADVERAVEMLRTTERGKWFSAAEPIWMRYHDAGHLLGSNSIEVEIRDSKPPLRITFSGDVGRYDGPLYHDPVPPAPCDYLVCESTYGDRDHPEASILDGLERVVLGSIQRGGVMLLASFAVGRAQQLIYLLQVLKSDNRIPDLPIYLDSPMACNATSIYRQHREDHDLAEGELDDARPVLAGPSVHLCRSVDESKALNHITGPAVIISSSGMMDAGRIVHHLKYRLPSTETPSCSVASWPSAPVVECSKTAQNISKCTVSRCRSVPQSRKSPALAATPTAADSCAGSSRSHHPNKPSSSTANQNPPKRSAKHSTTSGAGTSRFPTSANRSNLRNSPRASCPVFI